MLEYVPLADWAGAEEVDVDELRSSRDLQSYSTECGRYITDIFGALDAVGVEVGAEEMDVPLRLRVIAVERGELTGNCQKKPQTDGGSGRTSCYTQKALPSRHCLSTLTRR